MADAINNLFMLALHIVYHPLFVLQTACMK